MTEDAFLIWGYIFGKNVSSIDCSCTCLSFLGSVAINRLILFVVTLSKKLIHVQLQSMLLAILPKTFPQIERATFVIVACVNLLLEIANVNMV